MIRIILPTHLRSLANVGAEVVLDLPGQPSTAALLDRLEALYPMLRGTIRDQVTRERRPFLRFFACEEDLSFESTETPLPAPVVAGLEPFWIVGAISGG